MEKKLIVKGLSGDEGRSDIVRLHWQDRDDGKFKRWSVARLKCNGKSCYVVVLGQDRHPGYIELDYDHRKHFEVIKGKDYDFELKPVMLWGNIMYLVSARDPLLKLPARIAFISLALGLISILPMIFSILK